MPTRKAYTERQGNRILATNPKEDARMANPLIAFDPDGRPIIAGTQVTVKEVLKKLAAWGSVDRVLSAHPELGPPAAITGFFTVRRVPRIMLWTVFAIFFSKNN